MIKKELVVAKEPRSPISETFRALRTNLQFILHLLQKENLGFLQM